MIGGYTTFSTASVETIRLLLEDRIRAALTNGLINMIICIAAAAAGIALTHWIS